MAYKIGKAVTNSVKGYVGPGKRVSANFRVKTIKSRANTGSFRLKKSANTGGGAGSINSGGNFGPLGY
jgi:hypothetical protein